MKNKNKNNWRQPLLFVGLPLFILGLIIYLSIFIYHLYQRPDNQTFEPAKIINVSEPFSANFYFNDKLGSNDFADLIVKNIDNAKKSISLAMYSMDSTEIKDALLRASSRGVNVNLIFSNKHQAGELSLFQGKGDNINISFVGINNDGYMHHKFLIIDRGEATQKLFFSSYNFTDIQGKFDPSFIMETSRPEIVSVFGDEFDRLSSNEKWLAKKAKNYNPFAALINYPEGYLEIWFTPEYGNNNIKERMLSLIKNASSNIKIMAWYITDKDIASALTIKSKEKPVTIVTDDYNWSTTGYVFPIIAALNNLELVKDTKRNAQVSAILKNNDDLNSFLHHHLLIVDDKIALFGTNNWSSSGFFNNDESVMVSNISSVVSAFKQSYLFNYNTNR